MQVGCPAQVLVVDHTNGPANILVDVLSRLFEQVSFVVVVRDDEALYALNDYEFDLIVVGLENIQMNQFALLRSLRAEHVGIPILLIGQRLSHEDLEHCRQYEVREVIEMPRRAAELKSAVFDIMQRYLQCI
jgi:DNA-binding response OmpR family regulator